jgi:hypothetical protein
MATKTSDSRFSVSWNFLGVSVLLLAVTTLRFSQDMYAFAWSLIVLAGVFYLD